MKAHTDKFKEQIKTLGKEIDVKITYSISNETIELTSEDLNSVTPHYSGNILKSVMEELEIDSNIDIPKNTTINLKAGVKINEEYEYLNYGNYIVYSCEKQEDTNSHLIKCYDKMLLAMIDYEPLNVSYPITIKDFVYALCEKIGIQFANKNANFVNCDKIISKELYADLGYKFRDVLDELAEVTASTICINENDELEIRYVKSAINYDKIAGDILTFNSINENAKEIVIEGICSQKQTNGFQLFDVKKSQTYDSEWEHHGVTVSITKDGLIKLSGTATENLGYYNATFFYKETDTSKLKLIPSGSELCYKNCNIGKTSYLNSCLMLYFQDKSGNVKRLFGDIGFHIVERKITTEEDLYFIGAGLWLGANKQINVDGYQTKISLTIGEKEYEEYTGGIPGPNPYYPQEIKTIEGSFNIINCQKNLLNFKSDNYNWRNGKCHIEKNIVKLIGPQAINASLRNDTTFNCFIPKNTKITFSHRIIKGTENYIKGWIMPNIRYNFDDGTFFYENLTITPANRSKNKTYIFDKNITSITAYIGASEVMADDNVSGEVIIGLQLELGELTEYEEYKENAIEVLLDDHFLGEVNNKVKDNLKISYDLKDMKYYTILEKNVGRIIMNGTENWNKSMVSNNNSFYYSLKNNQNNFKLSDIKIDNLGEKDSEIIPHALSNNFKIISSKDVIFKNICGLTIDKITSENNLEIRIGFGLNSDINSVEKLKEYLSNNNIIIYYEKSETTTIVYENSISIKLFNGINNIFTDTKQNPNIKVEYPVSYDEIDEEFLNDTQALFKKKYGPINSIVLSRSAESDNVYLKDEDSISKNGLCEIKIVDNQIMNWEDRSSYLQGILDKLKNVEYYINDFSSSGICYYDLCDKYNIKIKDKIYKSIMFCNEQNINQGLEEIIFNEEPVVSETDYSKADKTDLKIKKTTLEVDKQNQKIEGLIQNISDNSENITSINASLGEISQKVNTIENNVNENTEFIVQKTGELNIKNNEILAKVTELKTTEEEDVSEINSQINILSDSISLKLSSSDFTSSAIIGLINNRDGTSTAKINASNINLYGKDINLTSDYITISSNNFNVDRNGNVTANNATLSGTFTQYSSSNKLSVKISNNQIRMYDWEGDGELTGTISASHMKDTGQHNLSLYCEQGNTLYLGYRAYSGSINPMLVIDTQDLSTTPYIANTVTGTIFPSNPYGGIIVEHGLIKDWTLKGLTGDIEIQTANGKLTLTLANGLIVSNSWS